MEMVMISFSRAKLKHAPLQHLKRQSKLAFLNAEKNATQRAIFALIFYSQVMVIAFFIVHVRSLMIPFLHSGFQILEQLEH